MVLADLEEEMGKVRWGGVRLGRERVYSLSYADDVVLMSEDKEGMKSIMVRLEKYLEEKKLELNSDKTMVVRFRKGRGRMDKRIWRWKGKKTEEVKAIKYLGYVFQRNGNQDAHVRDRVRRATAVMGQIWSIGKRRFGKDMGRKLWLFDKLVWTVLAYRVEIWGWEEREEMKKLEERYLRWCLGVDGKRPSYLIREELQREKLRGRAAKRAWGFEKRLKEGRGGVLTRRCWEEVKERAKRRKVEEGWEEERKRHFEGKGWKIEEMEKKREEGRFWYGVIEKMNKEKQTEERWKRIRESRYNNWYKEVKGRGLPGYLKKGWGKVDGEE
ncbi:hypothetical protein DMN91_008222 [Ooceraea biroi]|uniref:Reverse transcriptase domain-containing protein n=1 Tax=Ooceraea biroi TaxID=2015173 RepID=A0A3L8DGU4_OOCBI|nr:golgin subfamily A member 6-like protein 6 [Ooceraea biroi]RLU19665.1 hypothetical protein DMN91_008222 [Ooceraea biroi]